MAQHTPEPLVLMPIEKWPEIQDTFKKDLPRGVAGYSILAAQKKLMQNGLDYGFKAFCPYGDPWNGLVCINVKDTLYEIVIQCPRDDTSELEKALKSTKLIDWSREMLLPFTPGNVVECIKGIFDDINMEAEEIDPSVSFILYKHRKPENIKLPPTITFGFLTQEHAEFVDSSWPHRYPGSLWYFQLLIRYKCGYALYENNTLVAWVFVSEGGTLRHTYTVEQYRKKGYAELLVKLVCNVHLEENEFITAFSVKGNLPASNLYRKLGFERYYAGVAWCSLRPQRDKKGSAN